MSTDLPDTQQRLRIGEFSRRVGVDAELLRSWERRYALTAPARTPGGLRLYGAEEERRVRRMLAHLEDGLSAAEAAQLTLREAEAAAARPAGGPVAEAPVRPLVAVSPPSEPAVANPWGVEPAQLWEALDRLDDREANAIFDRLLASFSLSTVVRDAVLPYLRELGERWRAKGDAVIAQEHFATAVLRGRLLGLARGWGAGHGPTALLACFPNDFHDLGLICFGLALREHGWRITFLGANTPFASIEKTAEMIHPRLTVLAWTNPGTHEGAATALSAISARSSLALAGGGVDPEIAETAGAWLLTDDPFSAAQKVATDTAAQTGRAWA